MNVAHTPIRCPSARRFLHFSQRYAVLSGCMRAPNNMVLLEISSRARHRGGAPDYPLTKRELNLTQKDANSTAGSDVAKQTHPDDPSILDVVLQCRRILWNRCDGLWDAVIYADCTRLVSSVAICPELMVERTRSPRPFLWTGGCGHRYKDLK